MKNQGRERGGQQKGKGRKGDRSVYCVAEGRTARRKDLGGVVGCGRGVGLRMGRDDWGIDSLHT